MVKVSLGLRVYFWDGWEGDLLQARFFLRLLKDNLLLVDFIRVSHRHQAILSLWNLVYAQKVKFLNWLLARILLVHRSFTRVKFEFLNF